MPSQYVTELLTADGAPVGIAKSSPVDSSQALPDFPRLTTAQARARHGDPFTVGSTGGGGQWRMVAVAPPDGSGTLLVASSLEDVAATVAHLETLQLAIGLATLALVALAGGLVVRAALSPMRKVEETATVIAGGDLSRRVPVVDPRTEVGRLGTAFNTMLTRIEESFAAQAASEEEARRSEERMRRFVADASHELRTPLTSIRGFAELYRLQSQHGGGPAPREVSRSMGRIESEASRMGELVEDLLLLARLDRERPLHTEPVDLIEVAAGVVHDAAARAPGREVRLVAVPSDRPPVVEGDSARLHQVLTNLVDNALQHTTAAAPVEVRVAVVASGAGPERPGPDDRGARRHVVVDVVDHGAGLSPEEAAQVFERFWRADVSRNRSVGGAGLGLSIVRALVDRHGGTVEVADTPGGGATFRVRLPLAGPPARTRRAAEEVDPPRSDP